MIRDNIDWQKLQQEFQNAKPFHHCVIDNFWQETVAEQLYCEFPQYNSTVWNAHYNNAIENKKACNHWDKFPAATYQAFNFLGSELLQNKIRYVAKKPDLNLDFGLHGGGWHAHATGGNLNMHLDYNVHPKLGLQRKLNIIIYLVKDWSPDYGGGLELWSHNEQTLRPNEHVKTIELKFNRAVLFDTTQNSWHGLPYPLKCPPDKVRQSLAAYYLGPNPSSNEYRPKALFAPRKDQEGNNSIEQLIQRRSGSNFTDYNQ